MRCVILSYGGTFRVLSLSLVSTSCHGHILTLLSVGMILNIQIPMYFYGQRSLIFFKCSTATCNQVVLRSSALIYWSVYNDTLMGLNAQKESNSAMRRRYICV